MRAKNERYGNGSIIIVHIETFTETHNLTTPHRKQPHTHPSSVYRDAQYVMFMHTTAIIKHECINLCI